MYTILVYQVINGRIRHHDFQTFRSLFSMASFLETYNKFWKPKGFKVKVGRVEK